MSTEVTDRLREVFSKALGIEGGRVVDDLAYNSLPEWDSVAHMSLVAAIEDEFDLMLDTDDILDLSSFVKGVEIVQKNLGQ